MKEIKENIVKNDIKHDSYNSVINGDGKNGFYENSLVNVIRSKFHDLCLYSINKNSIVCF